MTAQSARGQQYFEPMLRVEPSAPTEVDDVRFELLFASANFLELGPVVVQGSRIEIALVVPAPCLILCPPFDQSITVPMGRLAPGEWAIAVDFAGQDHLETTVEVVPASPYRPSLRVLPGAPSDNDAVVLGFGLLVDDCLASEPALTAVEARSPQVVGGQILPGQVHVTLTRLLPGVPCDPAPLRPVPIVAALGSLQAGAYEVDLSLVDLAAPDAALGAASFTWPANDREPAALIARFDLVIADEDDLVTLEERFEVQVRWWTDDPGEARLARPVASADPSAQSAIFSFYDPRNWELMVKVLDGCVLNGHRWVFAAAATDLGYRIEVRDIVTGAFFTRENPAGTTSPAVTEVMALPCSEQETAAETQPWFVL